MASQQSVKISTTPNAMLFADHADDFNPTAVNNLEPGTATNVQMEFTGLADNAAVNGTKFDLGANFARRYALWFAFEGAATPTTATPVNFRVSGSTNSTAANANAGYVDGVDGAYTGTPATLAEGLAQLEFVGALIASADAATTIQIQKVGVYVPTSRYGSLVCENLTGAAFHSDGIEMHAYLEPLMDEAA